MLNLKTLSGWWRTFDGDWFRVWADEGRIEAFWLEGSPAHFSLLFKSSGPRPPPPYLRTAGPYMSLSLRFDRALVLAADLHRLQLRKGTEVPYIAHLLAVAAIVLEYGGNEDQAIAALLHDAVEDQGGAPMLAQIREEFGGAVAGIVEDCTDTDVTPKPPWRDTKEAYIQHLADVREDALIVSMADKLHNVRSIAADYRMIGESIWERFTGARNGTLWYYRALVMAFAERTKGPLLQQLDEELGLLEAHALSATAAGDSK